MTATCISGICGTTNAVTCAALDQCHVAGVCDPATGICSNPPKADGTTCNNEDACSTNDTCQNGVCSGTPVVCSPLSECHVAGTCDSSTGLCSDPPATAGTACGSPASCAGGTQHVQDAGACVPGAETSCGAYVCDATTCLTTCSSDSHCVPGAFCDANGQCQSDGAHGAACNDGAECQSGLCCGSLGACCSGSCCSDGTCSTAHSGGTCVCTPNCAPLTTCGQDDGCGNLCECTSGLICCGSGGSGTPAGCCAGACCGDVCCEFSGSMCCGSSPSQFCYTGSACP